MPFINHVEHYMTQYGVIRGVMTSYTSNNGLAHSNCIITCLQWKIGLHKADLQETKNCSTQA